MMHDPETLASAYLDGELTDDERRVAEADPAVMAEVEQLRALRADIADVEPPLDGARESAIGAAMAAFHDQFAESPPPAPVSSPESDRDAVVVPIWKRFASPQWLGTAAAALVLVVGVGVVATRTGGDDDDSIDVASDDATSEIMAADDGDAGEEPADMPDADADRIAESEMADETFAAAEPSDDAMDMATEMAEEPAEDAAGDMADEEALDDSSGSDGGADVLDGPPPLDDPALHFERNVPIVGPLQLRAAALYLLDLRDDGELGPTPEYRCEFYNVLGSARFDLDGETREVLLEIDEFDDTDRIVYAVERDGCLVVATVELDEP